MRPRSGSLNGATRIIRIGEMRELPNVEHGLLDPRLLAGAILQRLRMAAVSTDRPEPVACSARGARARRPLRLDEREPALSLIPLSLRTTAGSAQS
jgi:hypothetical protein